MPWLLALDRVRSLRTALLAGVVMSEAFTFAVFAWFAPAIAGYAAAPPLLGWLALVLFAPLLQPQFALFAVARTMARRGRAGLARTAIAGAGAYVGAEWLVPKLFADTIGYGFLASPLLRQAADLTGAPGLTFVLVVSNECVFAALGRLRARQPRAAAAPLLTVMALASALAVYGAVRLRQLDMDDESQAALTTAVVQADVSNYGRLAAEFGTYEAVRLILDRHFALSDAIPRPELLVWPETVYPTTFGAPKSDDGAAFDREIAGFVKSSGATLIFGAYDAGDAGAEYNAAFLLEPGRDGDLELDVYRKAYLFPLTERVPAWLDSERLRAWLPWLGTWRAGDGARVLEAKRAGGQPIRLAPMICYDAVVPSLAIEAVRAGAEIIVTLSNDSWFADHGGAGLHLTVSAFRSLETRRPQLRATNTGISAIVTSTGEYLGTLGVHERAALVRQVVPVRGVTTLMLLWGDWFGPVALVLASLALAVPGSRFQARTYLK